MRPEALAVAVVLGDDERAARPPRAVRTSVSAPVAVVAAGQHLQHRPRCRRPARPMPLAEQPHQRLGAGAPSSAIRSARSGASGCASRWRRCVADVGVDLGAVAAQQRLGEPAEHHAAGQVARPPGSGPGSRRPGAPARGRPARAAPRPAAAPVSHCAQQRRRSTAASADARCWARKIRKTAASSSGVRSRSVDAVVAEHLGEPGLEASPAARPARRRGSAGRCGSTRAGCARGCRPSASSPAGRLRLSSDRSANTVEQLDLARPAAGGRLGGRPRAAR